VLVGRTELDPAQKQAERRAKKSERSKKRKQDKANWKLVLKANPGLGNKYAKEDMLERLQAKNVKAGTVSVDAPDKFGRSNQFFAKLQQRAEMDKLKQKQPSLKKLKTS
jgi:U3 small nucleolar RNA-associated protein MPP10